MIYQLLPREAEFRTLDPGTGSSLHSIMTPSGSTTRQSQRVARRDRRHDPACGCHGARSRNFGGVLRLGRRRTEVGGERSAWLSHIALRVDDLDHALAADAESCTAPAGPSAVVVPRPGAPWIRRPGRRVGDPHRRAAPASVTLTPGRQSITPVMPGDAADSLATGPADPGGGSPPHSGAPATGNGERCPHRCRGSDCSSGRQTGHEPPRRAPDPVRAEASRCRARG